MDEPDSQNISFYWSNQFLNALFEQGVRHVIISPGSRSTPLTLAAAAHDGLTKTVILDERSAGYTALGIGKSTGFPAALICTSGTAGANYYPCVIESRQYGVPLIVLTADRPPRLQSIGANQAMDQRKLFGNYPVWSHDAGEPRMGKEDIRRIRNAGRQAIYYSRHHRGPVHLNFAFRKPLEPTPSFYRKIRAENRQNTDPSTSYHLVGSSVDQIPDNLKEDLQRCEQPLLIAGPEDPAYSLDSWGAELAESFNIPVLAEPGSGLTANRQSVPGFAGFLRRSHIASDLAPDLILRLGQQPATKALHHFLDRHRNVSHYHFTRQGLSQDAQLSTDYVIDGIPPSLADLEIEDFGDWRQTWTPFADEHRRLMHDVFKKTDRLSDGQVIRHLLQQLSSPWSLFLSNSFPVRDAALFGPLLQDNISTFVNRGVSGIDGINSTAAGVLRGAHQPTLLITGDLAFLHDTNMLLQQATLPAPLVIGIINNGGGTIFRMLPIGDHEETFTPYFETPQEASIASMAQTYDVNHAFVDSSTKLRNLSLQPYADQPGIHLVEFKTDADQSMYERRLLWDT